jgi:hypothetical protein
MLSVVVGDSSVVLLVTHHALEMAKTLSSIRFDWTIICLDQH